MAYQFYVYMVGQKTGQIKGSVTQKGREDSIGGLALSHSVGWPFDAANSTLGGTFQPQPLKFTKAWDKSTPVLLNILATRENLSSCEIRFWQTVTSATSGTGSEVQNMPYRITHANIVSISQYTASPDQLNQFDATQLEDITLVYQKFDVTYVEGGISAGWDWTARV